MSVKVEIKIPDHPKNPLADEELKEAFISCAASAIVAMRELTKTHNSSKKRITRRSDEIRRA